MVRCLLAGLLAVISGGLFGQSFKINTPLNFGDVQAGSMTRLSAWVVNLSDTPLIINDIPNSGGNLICGGFSKEPARKGDSLEINFLFHPYEGYTGVKKKGFTIKTNLGDQNIYVKANVISDDSVYFYAEQMPEFEGGEAELLSYIISNFTYPQQEELQTSFRVSFIIDTAGKVINPEITNPYYKDKLTLAEKNLLEVFKTMPAWTPGRHNGRKVPVRIQVPVKIDLK